MRANGSEPALTLMIVYKCISAWVIKIGKDVSIKAVLESECLEGVS